MDYLLETILRPAQKAVFKLSTFNPNLFYPI